MMKKLLILLCMLIIPAYAGTYEDALKSSDMVFLYLYTPDCRVCKEFDKTYNQLPKQNKDFKFVKVNVETSYGRRLILKYKGRFVPYIILTNSRTNKSVNVNHSCVMDEMCLLRALNSFQNK